MSDIFGYVQVICFKCKGCFPMHHKLNQDYRETGDRFFCPLCGQGQSYVRSKIDILNEKISDLERKLQNMTRYRDCSAERCEHAEAARDHAERRFNGLRGYLTKLKKNTA